MNGTWFECGIRYEKMQENGITKKVTESYLVKGISFSDAETNVIKEMSAYISGDFTVSTMKRANYTDIVTNTDKDDYCWFKCKINFISYDEKSGKEKKTGCYMLVQADSTEDAGKALQYWMSSTVCDYKIVSVSETNICDVFDTF